MSFVSFPHIYDPKNAFKRVSMRASYVGRDANDQPIYDGMRPKPLVTFVGQVKVHGTNAAIRFEEDGRIVCQQRGGDVPDDASHFGFKAFVQALPKSVTDLMLVQARQAFSRYETAQRLVALTSDEPVEEKAKFPFTIFGEWFGMGIVRGDTAVNKLKDKRFYIFAVSSGEHGSEEEGAEDTRVWGDIKGIDPHYHGILNANNYYGVSVDINFNSDASIAAGLKLMTECTTEVEEMCPVGRALGVEGTGEGIVWTALGDNDSRVWCKTKGDKHSKTTVKAVDPEADAKKSALASFAESLVTQGRINQAMDVLPANDKSKTGDVARWVVNDILREEALAIQESGFDEKSVTALLGRAASRKFLETLAAESG